MGCHHKLLLAIGTMSALKGLFKNCPLRDNHHLRNCPRVIPGCGSINKSVFSEVKKSGIQGKVISFLICGDLLYSKECLPD